MAIGMTIVVVGNNACEADTNTVLALICVVRRQGRKRIVLATHIGAYYWECGVTNGSVKGLLAGIEFVVAESGNRISELVHQLDYWEATLCQIYVGITRPSVAGIYQEGCDSVTTLLDGGLLLSSATCRFKF